MVENLNEITDEYELVKNYFRNGVINVTNYKEACFTIKENYKQLL
jgi:hypothetical protein